MAATLLMRGAQRWWWCCKSDINLYIYVWYWPVWASFSSLRPSPVAEKTGRIRPPSYFLSTGHQLLRHSNNRNIWTNVNLNISVSFKMSCSVPCCVSVYLISFASLYISSVTPIVTVERDNDRRQSTARSKDQSKNRERVKKNKLEATQLFHFIPWGPSITALHGFILKKPENCCKSKYISCLCWY